LLADEPTGNLDTERSREIMNLLTDLNRDKGITVVMVTHEADMAEYAHRVVRLVDGRIASDVRQAERQDGRPGMIWNALLLALREIRRNLMRSFLTILGIVIGVSAVITMVTLGNGATRAVSQDRQPGQQPADHAARPAPRPGRTRRAAAFKVADADALRNQVNGLAARSCR
jgi:energy-coupling factor transporter ATP-binding protein EcfA2